MSARDNVSFLSAGTQIDAWFYPPSGEARPPWPAVVLGHGFAGVKDARLDAFAAEFAAVGLGCLVFDYRHFGGSGGEPRQVINIREQREDWHAAIGYVRARPDVDAGRIALWGTSFGGGLVLEILRLDKAIAAAVLHMPLVDALASAKEEGLLQTLRLTAASVRDMYGRLRHGPPHLIRVVGRPGSRAVMTQPEAEPGYISIVRNAPSWRNEVAARIILEMALFRPGRSTSRIQCPMLFVVGTKDRITPPLATIRAAVRAPQARIVSLPVGHFDAYLGSPFRQAVSAEASFLAEHLLGAPADHSSHRSELVRA
jgi:fermentation-respiration switch protein FrsA (DUF1100 family)